MKSISVIVSVVEENLPAITRVTDVVTEEVNAQITPGGNLNGEGKRVKRVGVEGKGVLAVTGKVSTSNQIGTEVDIDQTFLVKVLPMDDIHTFAQESVRITSFGGVLLRHFTVPDGDYQTQMPEGLYIVQVGKDCFKVKM